MTVAQITTQQSDAQDKNRTKYLQFENPTQLFTLKEDDTTTTGRRKEKKRKKRKKRKGVLNNIMTIAMENIAEIMYVCMYACPSFFPSPNFSQWTQPLHKHCDVPTSIRVIQILYTNPVIIYICKFDCFIEHQISNQTVCITIQHIIVSYHNDHRVCIFSVGE